MSRREELQTKLALWRDRYEGALERLYTDLVQGAGGDYLRGAAKAVDQIGYYVAVIETQLDRIAEEES